MGKDDGIANSAGESARATRALLEGICRNKPSEMKVIEKQVPPLRSGRDDRVVFVSSERAEN